MEMMFKHGTSTYKVEVERKGEEYSILIGEKEYKVNAREIKPGLIQIGHGNDVQKFVVSTNKDERHVFLKGGVFKLKRVEGSSQASVQDDVGDLNSPITGKVVAIKVKEGDKVSEKQTLMILEAMKMEYQIKAPYSGLVKKILFEEGKPVDIGALLIDLQKEDEAGGKPEETKPEEKEAKETKAPKTRKETGKTNKNVGKKKGGD
ncbi:MAG: biotin/lipoyl-binding protein [Candidatus Thermoplasmatota archaeon]|nr:biotin/lipoyl-binding protein [Candidatus Thermoplasmatota archaeon]